MAVKVFFYDIGGVLVKLIMDKAFEKFSLASGKTVQDMRKIFSDLDICRSYETGEMSSQEFYRKISDLTGVKMSFEEFAKVWCDDVFIENRPEIECLKRLKQKYRIFLLSNTNELHYKYLLSTLPVLRLVDGAVLSYEVGACKPEKKIYLEALKAADAKPHECVFIDDTKENIEAARSLGIRAVLYKNQVSVPNFSKK